MRALGYLLYNKDFCMRLGLIAIGFAASIERAVAQSEVLEDQLDQLAGANSAGAHWPHV